MNFFDKGKRKLCQLLGEWLSPSSYIFILLRPESLLLYKIQKKGKWTLLKAFDGGIEEGALDREELSSLVKKTPVVVSLDFPEVKVSLEGPYEIERGFWKQIRKRGKEKEILEKAWGEESWGRVTELETPLEKRTHLIWGLSVGEVVKPWQEVCQSLGWVPFSTTLVPFLWCRLLKREDFSTSFSFGILCGKSGHGYQWICWEEQLFFYGTFSLSPDMIQSPETFLFPFLQESIQSMASYLRRNFSASKIQGVLMTDFWEGPTDPPSEDPFLDLHFYGWRDRGEILGSSARSCASLEDLGAWFLSQGHRPRESLFPQEKMKAWINFYGFKILAWTLLLQIGGCQGGALLQGGYLLQQVYAQKGLEDQCRSLEPLDSLSQEKEKAFDDVQPLIQEYEKIFFSPLEMIPLLEKNCLSLGRLMSWEWGEEKGISFLKLVFVCSVSHPPSQETLKVLEEVFAPARLTWEKRGKRNSKTLTFILKIQGVSLGGLTKEVEE